MNPELTHVRLPVELRDRIASLCEKTGLTNHRLLEMCVTDFLAAVESDDPPEPLPSIGKIRVLLGKVPDQASYVMEELATMKANIAALQKTRAKYSAKQEGK